MQPGVHTGKVFLDSTCPGNKIKQIDNLRDKAAFY